MQGKFYFTEYNLGTGQITYLPNNNAKEDYVWIFFTKNRKGKWLSGANEDIISLSKPTTLKYLKLHYGHEILVGIEEALASI